MKHRLLLVDDETLSLQIARDFLQGEGYLVDCATSGEEAITLVTATPYRYSLVILDYRMKGKNGAVTVETLTSINPDLFVLIYSGDPSREALIRSTRGGARGFVDKSEGPSVLLAEIGRWCRKFEATYATVANEPTQDDNESAIASIGMVGRSTRMAELAATIIKLRERTGSVLILGESGTGKELVARAIHHPSHGAFRAINCAMFASNPQLMSSTLFGHVRGAFTGAVADKRGILEEVEGGSVFLDEIYALPPTSQLELLRVLEERVITPVGSNKERPVHFRLIAAAKPTLHELVRTGAFAADLFYRVGRTILSIPALRERTEDIEPLVRFFCNRWSKENGEQKTFLLRTLPFLEAYPWNGNVRELENLIYSLLDLSSSPKIGPEHLDAKFFTQKTSQAQSSTSPLSLKDRLEDTERQHLAKVLSCSRSLREASRRMGVSLTTVLRLMKKHELNADEYLIHKRTNPPHKIEERDE